MNADQIDSLAAEGFLSEVVQRKVTRDRLRHRGTEQPAPQRSNRSPSGFQLWKLFALLLVGFLFFEGYSIAQTGRSGVQRLLNITSLDSGEYLLDVDGDNARLFTIEIVEPEIGGPDPDPDPPIDQFGLVSYSQSLLPQVPEYANKERDAARLAGVYSTVSDLIAEGKLKQPTHAAQALREALDRTLKWDANRNGNMEVWRAGFIDPIRAKLREHSQIDTLPEIQQAFAEISHGLAGGKSSSAFGDGQFLKWLTEVLLPFIIKLIELFD